MNETTAIKEENVEYKKLSPEQQEYYKIQQEKEAYEEAFNKLSNEEKKIINNV